MQDPNDTFATLKNQDTCNLLNNNAFNTNSEDLDAIISPIMARELHQLRQMILKCTRNSPTYTRSIPCKPQHLQISPTIVDIEVPKHF